MNKQTISVFNDCKKILYDNYINLNGNLNFKGVENAKLIIKPDLKSLAYSEQEGRFKTIVYLQHDNFELGSLKVLLAHELMHILFDFLGWSQRLLNKYPVRFKVNNYLNVVHDIPINLQLRMIFQDVSDNVWIALNSTGNYKYLNSDLQDKINDFCNKTNAKTSLIDLTQVFENIFPEVIIPLLTKGEIKIIEESLK